METRKPNRPEDFLRLPYARILIPEDTGYSAEILEFPGCFSQGDSAQEALSNLEKAAAAWIESSLKLGQEIPPPSATQGHVGKIALRLPRSLHKRAAQLAQRDGTSLNQFLVSAIAARVGAEDLYARMIHKIEERLRQIEPGATRFDLPTPCTDPSIIDLLEAREPFPPPIETPVRKPRTRKKKE